MNGVELLRGAPGILMEGAIIERLRRDSSIRLDPAVLNTVLLGSVEGRKVLRCISREYLDVGARYGLPMMVCTPTWKANPERLAKVNLGTVRQVSAGAFGYLDDIRNGYGSYAKMVLIGGLLGNRGDAYRGDHALQEEEAAAFHCEQAEALAEAGVDFLLAATLPALTEAVGIARAMALTGKPYVVSFIVRRSGRLLDGTSLAAAMETIDGVVVPPPAFYLVNCVHPAVFEEAVSADECYRKNPSCRLTGLQANTSTRNPEELDGLPELDQEDPHLFAGSMMHACHRFGLRVLGGCCGTDARHIEALAVRMAPRKRSDNEED